MFNKKLKMSIIWIAAAIMTISACLLSVLLIAPFGGNKGSDITGGALGDPVAPVLSNETCGMHIKKPNSVNSEDYEICTNKVHLINTEEELLYLMGAQANTFAGACFKMNMKEVSLTGWAAIGLFNNGTAAGGTFTGHFNGNGASIMYMLTESENSAKLGKGLFPNVTGGTIENLTANVIVMQAPQASYTQGYLGTQFANAYVTGVNLNVMSFQQVSTNVGYSAGLVYNATSATLIENSNVNFLATTPMAMTYFGGLVHNLESSRLNSCKVTYTGTADMTLSYYGGAAYQTRTTANHTISPSIENCSVTLPEIVGTGNVTWNYFGGLVYDGSGSPGAKYLNNTVKTSDIKGSTYSKIFNTFGGIVYNNNSPGVTIDGCNVTFGDGFHQYTTGAGIAYANSGENTSITNCQINIGQNSSGRYTNNNFSGVAYDTGKNSLIENVTVNFAKPNGPQGNNTTVNMGGIVLYNNGENAVIRRCNVKFGDGDQNIYQMGGIARYNSGLNAKIESCSVNFGNGARTMYTFGGIAEWNSSVDNHTGNSGKILNCNVKFGDGTSTIYDFGGITKRNGGALGAIIDGCSVDFGGGDFARNIYQGGGIARYNSGSIENEITNSTVVMPKDGTYTVNAFGGIAEYNNQYGVARYHLIENCSVKYPRTANLRTNGAYFGGIVSRLQTYSKIVDCDVDLNMDAATSRYTYIGGLAAYAEGLQQIENVLIAGDGLYGTNQTGGLIGHYYVANTQTSTFKNCNVTLTTIRGASGGNNWTVLADGVGGLFGSMRMGNLNSANPKVVIEDSGNWANIDMYSGQNSGGIIGQLYEGGVLTMNRVTNSGNVTSTKGYYYAGGFIGAMVAPHTLIFNDCINYGDISAEHCVGGFLGHAVDRWTNNSRYTFEMQFNNCKNYGNMTTQSTTNDAQIGGIIGHVYTDDKLSFINVENYGKINASQCSSSNSYAGGIMASATTTPRLSMRNVTNYADIVGNGKYVGGLVGQIEDTADVANLYLMELKNFGNITNTAFAYTGGIFGYLNGGFFNRDVNSVSEQWINWGNVTSSSTYIGGIAGYLHNGSQTLNVKNITNYGNIESKLVSFVDASYVGGLFGYLNAANLNDMAQADDAQLQLINYGNVISRMGGHVGGLIGVLGSSTIKAYEMYNYGATVSGDGTYVAGLIGFVSSSNINSGETRITKAENYAEVTSSRNNYVGGLFGHINSGTHVFTQVKNTKPVTGNAGYVGGIIGGAASSTFTMITATNYMQIMANGSYEGGIAGDFSSCTINNNINDQIIWRNYGDIQGGTGFVGGIAGRITSGTQRFTKVHNSGNINVKVNSDNVGGIFGQVASTTITNTEITGDPADAPDASNGVTDVDYNMANFGTVGGRHQVGGIVGHLASSTTYFRNAVNYANITATGYNVGGLFGYNNASHFYKENVSNNQVMFRGENWGDVITTTDSTAGYSAGGLFGHVINAPYVNIASFINHGKKVEGCYDVGGFVGFSSNSAIRFEGDSENAFINYANITSTFSNAGATGVSSNDYGTAGIIGRVFANTGSNNNLDMTGAGDTAYVVKMANVTNYGKVLSVGYNTTIESHAGGFIGYLQTSSISIINCKNYGDIEALGHYVGGMIGYYGTGHTSRVDRFENYGNIKTSNNSAGGFIGHSATGYWSFTGTNVNYGSVTALGIQAGGMFGQASGGSITVNGANNNNNFKNIGNVTVGVNNDGSIVGGNYAGGMIGYAASVTLDLRNIVNYGDIHANAECSGGFIGYTDGNMSHKYYNCENYGNVFGKRDYVGGFVGRSASSPTIEVMLYGNTGRKNANHGYVSGERGFVGGIFGRIDGGTTRIYNTYNYSPLVTNSFADVNGGDHVGGLIGYCAATLYLSKVENHSNINVKGSYGGGLVGYATTTTYFSSAANYGSEVDLDGNVVTPFVSATGSYVGGLAGRTGAVYFEYGTDANGHPTGSINLSTMQYTQNSADVVASGSNVGGLTGYSSTAYYGRVDNYGKVSGMDYVGGFTGYQAGDITSTNIAAGGNPVYRTNSGGSVTGISYVGGLFGRSDVNGTDIWKMVNFANVTSNGDAANYTGGVFGYYQYLQPQAMHDIANYGNVKGTTAVGGVIGYYIYPWTSQTNALSCIFNSVINHGTIEGKRNVGGIIGTIWRGDYTSYYNNIYLRSVENYGNITGGTSIGTSGNNGLGTTGGLVGYIYRTRIYIHDASADGSIQSTDRTAQYGTISTNGSYTGSLIGEAFNYSYVFIYNIKYVRNNENTDITRFVGNMNGLPSSISATEANGQEVVVTEAPSGVKVLTKNIARVAGEVQAKLAVPTKKSPVADTGSAYVMKPATPPIADVAPDKPTTPDIPLAPDKPAKNIIVETQLTDMKVTTTFLFAELSGFHIESLHISVAGMEETKYTQLIHNGVVVNYLGNTSNPLGTEVKMWDAAQPRPFEKTFIVSYDAKTTIETVSYKLVGKNTQTGKVRTWTIMGNGGVTEIK